MRAVTSQSSRSSSLEPGSLPSQRLGHHHGGAVQRSTGAPLPPRQFSAELNVDIERMRLPMRFESLCAPRKEES
ncbi:hypothetical protein KF707C_26510 [Metapseudomonas furukawaii]|uniref:Uncharacterized protein n=1 Tax=Metapseudomonas furukawaii TaxID=1149133 RepID=A0AAD1FFU4_METFU|nr:hypothetical protein KF707C_26510 [Pseudomonas furukawaii]